MILKDNKKAIIGMDYLIGIVLSTIALVFASIVIFSVLLVTPTNEKIADDNAKSIAEFVNYFNEKSNNDYKDFGQCFNSMKLNHLEKFQYKEDDYKKNYVYVISNKEISVVKYVDYLKLSDEDKKHLLYKKAVKQYEFDDEIILKIDDTEKGKWYHGDIDLEFIPITTIGKSSNSIIYDNDKNLEYIILIPNIGDSKKYFKIDLIYSKGKSWFSSLFSDDNVTIKTKQYNYEIGELFFDNDKKILFVPKTDFTNLVIDNNLCSNKEQILKDLKNYYLAKEETGNYINLEKIDYINKEIKISYVDKNQQEKEYCKYIRNGIMCSNKEAYDYIDGFDYKNSINNTKNEKLKGFLFNKDNTINVLDLKKVFEGFTKYVSQRNDLAYGNVTIDFRDLAFDEYENYNCSNNCKNNFEKQIPTYYVFEENIDYMNRSEDLECVYNSDNYKDVFSFREFFKNDLEINGEDNNEFSHLSYSDSSKLFFYLYKIQKKNRCSNVLQQLTGDRFDYASNHLYESTIDNPKYDLTYYRDNINIASNERIISFNFTDEVYITNPDFPPRVDKINRIYIGIFNKDTKKLREIYSYAIPSIRDYQNYYYSIKPDWFRKRINEKNEIEIYFNGKKLTKVDNLDSDVKAFNYELPKNFFLDKFDNNEKIDYAKNNGNFNILISSTQLFLIPDFKINSNLIENE